jgi:ABC-2 type transport system permease protein
MADVAQLPGVTEQVRMVAKLRWLILKNGLRNKNKRWDLIAMIWVSLFSAAMVLGLCFAFYAGGYEFISKNRAGWTALLYWGIFLWWQVFPIFVAGFGANFEFANLLRFPLSLRAFYILGLGYGLSDFGAISSICWVLSMIAGAASARMSVVPVMMLVSLLFVLLNVTMERLMGSWLEKLLAKRRSREVFLGVFILSMVSLNFLSPAFQRWGTLGKRPKILELIPYLSWLPGSLAGDAVGAAAGADSRGYVMGMAGLVAWVGILSVLLWRRFAAQYSGEEIGDSPAPAVPRKREKRKIVAEERPGLFPPQLAAIVTKEFHYLKRNGLFSFLTLILPIVMVFFFTLQFGPGSALKHHSIKPGLFFPGIMAYLLLILLSPAYNSFAFEGKGIQTYFMAPVGFRDVLLGKNLVLTALVGFELTLSLALLTYRIGWPGMPLFLATVAAGAFAVTGQLAIANWSSLSFPKKMEIGKLKGQRNSGIAVWTAFGVQIVLGGICALVLLAGQWTGNPWLPVIAFAGLTAAAVGGYVASLNVMNGLAEKKKDLLIETLCR